MAGGAVVGIVSDVYTPTDFRICLDALMAQRHDVFEGRIITSRGYAGRLDVGRHLVAKTFVEGTDADYLLMLDDDIVFTVQDFDRLYDDVRKADDAVVSGLYVREDGTPCVFDEVADGEGRVGLRNVTPDQLVGKPWYEAGSVGLGFCLVPRRVLEAVKEAMPDGYPLPWFESVGRLADDSSFCFRVREAGFKIWVDTKVQVGHLKLIPMFPNLPETSVVVPEKKLYVPGRWEGR